MGFLIQIMYLLEKMKVNTVSKLVSITRIKCMTEVSRNWHIPTTQKFLLSTDEGY